MTIQEEDFTGQKICYFPGIDQTDQHQLRTSSERKIHEMTVGALFAQGGEGRIYTMQTPHPLYGKIYKTESREQERFLKLECMRRNPPRELPSNAIAWPLSFIHTMSALQQPHAAIHTIGQKGYLGYLMPKIDTTQFVTLEAVTDPKIRSTRFPGFTWKHLVHTAKNLAHFVSVFHKLGYVICDLSERNVLANAFAQIGFVDCDSMQVRDPTSGYVFRAYAYTPSYAPPEILLGKAAIRESHQDTFSLAIILFKLLLGNWHPAEGRLLQPIALDVVQCIVNGIYSFIPNNFLAPPPNVPPLSILPSAIQQLFVQAFVLGHQRPDLRPSARTWFAALERMEGQLRQCERTKQHWYSQHLSQCPWH